MIKTILNAKPFFIMGHRGGLLEVVENTMDGVELTVSKEIGLECDVVKTKDGKYILCHDNYLERLTG
jgi:glycerophosphoryl diester phosphodiesterase